MRADWSRAVVCESIDHGNDVTFLVFLKIILLFFNMDKEEPNFNTWGEIFDSELVLEAAKVEQIYYEKQQEKRRYAQLEKNDWQNLVAGAEAKSTQKNTK